MANPVGFLELERVEQKSENPEKRIGHYKEFVKTLSEKERQFSCGEKESIVGPTTFSYSPFS